MNITSISTADKLIPVSKARSNLSKLMEKLEKTDYFVLVNKYKPKAALVSLPYLEKLMKIYNDWSKKKDFDELDRIRREIPVIPEEEVERDIAYALKQVRKKYKNRS